MVHARRKTALVDPTRALDVCLARTVRVLADHDIGRLRPALARRKNFVRFSERAALHVARGPRRHQPHVWAERGSPANPR